MAPIPGAVAAIKLQCRPGIGRQQHAQRVSEQQIIAHLVAQMIAAINADAQPRGALSMSRTTARNSCGQPSGISSTLSNKPASAARSPCLIALRVALGADALGELRSRLVAGPPPPSG